MLIQFTVSNYKTFAEETKISLVASKDSTYRDTNVFDSNFKYDLLKTAVIYGANASGKTKFIEALGFLKEIVFDSANYQSTKKINATPFRLSTQKINEPSLFEIIFIEDNVMYRYGFEITTEKVVSEWLFMRQNNSKPKEIELFYREEQEFEFHPKHFKIKDLIDNNRIKTNSLLLSVADASNVKLAKVVSKWINWQMQVISGLKMDVYLEYTVNELSKDINKKNILNFLKDADLEIIDLLPQMSKISELPKQIQEIIASKNQNKEDGNFFSDVKTFKKQYNQDNEFVGLEEFSMDNDESLGTRKYFALSAPIIDVLENGLILVVDELDASLHPNLTQKIIELFHSKETNPKNAQLIFNTHNTNLLNPSSNLFRRDQIWFVKKDHYGAASLYSLADFKTNEVRKDDNYEKDYIAGQYGAIPYLGDFETLKNKENGN
ncbi:ATP/GTP-binding protein [Bernardetia sp. OM2101]|uniref:AAA family ATPase n=1 Tax=Bernardetia sp. OM2101 TaxID=3344876 RepID=UPI0035CF10D7